MSKCLIQTSSHALMHLIVHINGYRFATTHHYYYMCYCIILQQHIMSTFSDCTAVQLWILNTICTNKQNTRQSIEEQAKVKATRLCNCWWAGRQRHTLPAISTELGKLPPWGAPPLGGNLTLDYPHGG